MHESSAPLIRILSVVVSTKVDKNNLQFYLVAFVKPHASTPRQYDKEQRPCYREHVDDVQIALKLLTVD
jgi:hypothetical protein